MQTPIFTHPYAGSLIIGAGGYAEILTNAFVKFSGMNTRLHTTGTMDGTLALIRQLRAGA